MIKIQYISTMALMLLTASGLIFETTGRSEYFVQILGAMTIGTILGLSAYILCLYCGTWATNRVTNIISNKIQNKKAYLKIK
jgi:hypothetical protein